MTQVKTWCYYSAFFYFHRILLKHEINIIFIVLEPIREIILI